MGDQGTRGGGRRATSFSLTLSIDGRPLAGEAELEEGQAAELSALPPPGARLSLELAGAPLEPYLRPGDPAWRWRWLAPGAAGAYELLLRASWPDGARAELRASLRVLPRKLDLDHYHALLDDLQSLGRSLALALGGGAEPGALPRDPEAAPLTPVEELASLFGPDLEQLAVAVERLGRRPPDRLRSAVTPVEPGRVRDLASIDRVQPPASPPAGDELRDLLATLPSLPERRPDPGYDSYEHRLLRRLLDTLWGRLTRLLALPGLPAPALAQATAARERLRGLRALPFLAQVPPLADYRGPTPRLQRDPELRAVYRYWQRLRRRPLLAWDAATLALPVAELPRLYERWCAARTAMALLELPGWQVAEQGIVAAAEEGAELRLGLPEGPPLLVLARADGARLALRYQARYAPLARARGAELAALDRHSRVPDLALELRAPGAAARVVVLDAKYRLDASGGVPADALADAYSYLGGIGGPDGVRATLGAALLYPGRGRAEIYPSGVAALPLLPGASPALTEWLAAIVSSN